MSTNGSTTGIFFEMVLVDALVQFGVPEQLIYGQQKHREVNVELDVLVGRRQTGSRAVGLMLKTSLRERWKQMDRDAMIFTFHPEAFPQMNATMNNGIAADSTQLSIWGVTIREDAKKPPQKAVQHARRMARKCIGIRNTHLISIYDSEGMERLLREVLSV
jgi:hypothetical protein